MFLISRPDYLLPISTSGDDRRSEGVELPSDFAAPYLRLHVCVDDPTGYVEPDGKEIHLTNRLFQSHLAQQVRDKLISVEVSEAAAADPFRVLIREVVCLTETAIASVRPRWLSVRGQTQRVGAAVLAQEGATSYFSFAISENFAHSLVSIGNLNTCPDLLSTGYFRPLPGFCLNSKLVWLLLAEAANPTLLNDD